MTIETTDRLSSNGLVHDAQRLKELQALPLERKVGVTLARISEWYNHYSGSVCVSFSGGKDSTVLLYLARSIFPDIKAVYVDTGLEYPEVKEFIRSFDNVDIIRPKKMFRNVITEYGYPIISKEVAECIYYARRHTCQTNSTHTHTHTIQENCRVARDANRCVAEPISTGAGG